MKIDLKTILILLLVAIVVIQRLWDKKDEQHNIVKVNGKKYELIKHIRDTVEVVKKEVVIRQGRDIYHDRTIYVDVPAKVDTTTILKEFFAKNIYQDTLRLPDSLGFVVVTDTISKNTIQYRKYDSKVVQRQINDITVVKELPKNQYYGGFNVGISSNVLNTVGAGVILKNKKDKVYELGIGLTQSIKPYVGVGMYWKIK